MAERQQYAVNVGSGWIFSSSVLKKQPVATGKVTVNQQSARGENNARRTALQRVSQSIDHCFRDFFRTRLVAGSRRFIEEMNGGKPRKFGSAPPHVLAHDDLVVDVTLPGFVGVKLVSPAGSQAIPPQLALATKAPADGGRQKAPCDSILPQLAKRPIERTAQYVIRHAGA
jgi:hypothetical protein